MGLLSSISDFAKTAAPFIPVYGPLITAGAKVFDAAWNIVEPMGDKLVVDNVKDGDFKNIWLSL